MVYIINYIITPVSVSAYVHILNIFNCGKRLYFQLLFAIRACIVYNTMLRWFILSMKISEIKDILAGSKLNELPKITEQFKADERAGVIKLVAQYEKKYNAYLAEIERMKKLSEMERELRANGYKLVAGIDEVGRGPLAGPVVTAAVILPDDCDILGINDSKKLSASKREELSAEIREKAVAWALGSCSPAEIDEINILQATYKAMAKAINSLVPQPDFVLADAVTIPAITMKQRAVIKGDAKCITIGAASIVAKVERDAMMVKYAEVFPEYGFESNKGYGSAEHIAAIKEYGPCPIHRKSFITHFV